MKKARTIYDELPDDIYDQGSTGRRNRFRKDFKISNSDKGIWVRNGDGWSFFHIGFVRKAYCSDWCTRDFKFNEIERKQMLDSGMTNNDIFAFEQLMRYCCTQNNGTVVAIMRGIWDGSNETQNAFLCQHLGSQDNPEEDAKEAKHDFVTFF